jgi:N-acetylneuraminic acid mutarotase
MKMNIKFTGIKQIISNLMILFLILLIVVPQMANLVAGDQADYKLVNRTDVLPYPFSRGSAAWVEEQQAIYIFGGRNETEMLDRIMKYTPANDKLEILDTHLPNVLMGTTAVYDGNHIYIFGGRDFDGFYDSILRFDPVTHSITNMTARLPKPTVGAAAVWTGEYIYFFGGSWGGIEPQKFDTILQYDPVKDNITIMSSTLTFGRSGLAASTDGEFIYIIGGSDGKQYSSEVFKYSPERDNLTVLPGKLPQGWAHVQAEFHNGSIYIFGGRTGPATVIGEIVEYNLETNTAEILNQTLPNPSEFRMHAYDSEKIYIIGGFNGPKDINQFIIFTPESQLIEDTDKYCPPDETDVFPYIVLAILAFVIILTIMNHYWRKK